MTKQLARYRVLIVDDCRVFRNIMEKALADVDDVEVAGSVADGQQAIDFVKRTPVDIVTLDVEMPGLDGLQTLERLQAINQARPVAEQYGIVMVSAHTTKGAETTITALQSGAFDFIAKPDEAKSDANFEALKRQLLVKIRCYVSQRQLRQARVAVKPDSADATKTVTPAKNGRQFRAIVIGVSTGGPKALGELLPTLCKQTDLPILIVQHMPPDFTKSLADSLSKHCTVPVTEGIDGQAVEKGHIYIAPGGRHMLVRKTGSNALVLTVNDQPPENGCRPAVDVLFRSAAVAFGSEALALILTGMGSDGTKGLQPLKRAGAYCIVQDEESSVVWGMPGSAVREGLVDTVLPLNKIASYIGELIQRGG